MRLTFGEWVRMYRLILGAGWKSRSCASPASSVCAVADPLLCICDTCSCGER